MAQSTILGQIFLWDFGLQGAEETYETDEFKRLMGSKEEYDLVITESFFAMESMVALGHRFKAPNIVICTFGVAPNSLDFNGENSLWSIYQLVCFDKFIGIFNVQIIYLGYLHQGT